MWGRVPFEGPGGRDTRFVLTVTTETSRGPTTTGEAAPTDQTVSAPKSTTPPSESTTHDFADAKDRALLAAHRAGDATALPELLESYQDRLFSVCMRMVNCPERAADLTQESMVKIIMGVDAFAGRSKLSTWIFRVTMNVCLTHRRRQRLRNHLSIDLPASRANGGDEGGASIAANLTDTGERSCEETIEARESRRRLYKSMDRLEPDARAILILRDVQELDYKQIAEILEVPQGTVKSRLFRARAALRDQIERLGSSGV